MFATQPPEPVEPENLRQTVMLYNADTGQPIGGALQRWANDFRLPGGQSLKVRLQPFSGQAHYGETQNRPAAMAQGATPEDDVLYFDPAQLRGRKGKAEMLHELTHRHDYRYGNDATRQRFSQIMGFGPETEWRGGADSPNEMFSEASAAYQMGARAPDLSSDRDYNTFYGGYGFEPDRRQWREIKNLFRSIDPLPPAAPIRTRAARFHRGGKRRYRR